MTRSLTVLEAASTVTRINSSLPDMSQILKCQQDPKRIHTTVGCYDSYTIFHTDNHKILHRQTQDGEDRVALTWEEGADIHEGVEYPRFIEIERLF